MLSKALKIEYEDARLGDQMAKLIATMIASDELTLRVFVEIGKRDRLIRGRQDVSEEDNAVIYGVTKEEIRTSIHLGKHKAPTGKHKGKMVEWYPAIKKIDSIVSNLMGSTIVYCEVNGNKEKRYSYTARALEVIRKLTQAGVLKKEDFEVESC